jgi:biopolymer transport protein ExbD
MSLRVRRRHHKDDPTELNITAFLNLMVILVPFLLISAVFSRMTILELNIPPAPPASDNQPKKEFQLVVTIRSHSIDVGDTLGGLIKSIPANMDGYDYLALSRLLKTIKARFPEKTTASILLEPDIAYDTLVQVMDKVRVAIAVQAGSAVKVELFPDISIGDAPMLEVTSSVGGAG